MMHMALINPLNWHSRRDLGLQAEAQFDSRWKKKMESWDKLGSELPQLIDKAFPTL